VLWNNFVSKAKNATFLFYRDFMDYHSDRFQDYSLMVYDDKKLVALLPANRVGLEIHSHQGLTYGGLVLDQSLKLKETIEVTKAILSYLDTHKIKTLHIKLLPEIYVTTPSGELEYILFLLEAKLFRRDVLSVINNIHPPKSISTVRKRGIKRAKDNQLIIKEDNDFEAFWTLVLIPNLERRFNQKPVHSLSEIQLLQKKFPKNIRQFNVYNNDKIVAGTTIFETKMVAHAQYISATEQKQELGSLDFLFNELVLNVFKDKSFFDFGISNENRGRNLNQGLLYWKESFGARTITQEFYSIKTANHSFLNDILI